MQKIISAAILVVVLFQCLQAVKVSSANKTLEGINVTISSTPSDFGGGKRLTITPTNPGSLEGLKSLELLMQACDVETNCNSENTKKPYVVQLTSDALEILDAVQQALINQEES